MKRLKILSWSLVLSVFLLSCEPVRGEYADNGKNKKEQKKNKIANAGNAETASAAITIVQKWELPDILLEISGISFIGNDQFASVQDEAGVIFIYNTKENKIDRTVTFGAAGDYEGIAMVGRVAYVVRSDGNIFEVNNIDTSSPKIQEFDTPLTAANNVEGITYDAKNNRLLLAIKGAETSAKDYKGIYAFDLKTKKLAAEPIFKLSLTDPALPAQKSKKPGSALQPSELAVHPVTGHIYLTEAVNPQLFVLDTTGKIITRYKLDSQVFTQPEGLTFSPAGDLYISNEGKKSKGNILNVRIVE
jgi:uncharacterized protein YjiK